MSPRFPLFNRGITATRPSATDGSIWLDFSPEVVNESLYRLQSLVADLLERNPAVGGPRRIFGPDFPPQMPLLSHADLPDSVFDSALEFARAGHRRPQSVPNHPRLAADPNPLRIRRRRRRLGPRALGLRLAVAGHRQLQPVTGGRRPSLSGYR